MLVCFCCAEVKRENEEPFPMATWEEKHRARSLIKFSFDETELKSGARLSRAPTPYPKELRALAKHARNLASGSRAAASLAHKDSFVVEDPAKPAGDDLTELIIGSPIGATTDSTAVYSPAESSSAAASRKPDVDNSTVAAAVHEDSSAADHEGSSPGEVTVASDVKEDAVQQKDKAVAEEQLTATASQVRHPLQQL